MIGVLERKADGAASKIDKLSELLDDKSLTKKRREKASQNLFKVQSELANLEKSITSETRKAQKLLTRDQEAQQILAELEGDRRDTKQTSDYFKQRLAHATDRIQELIHEEKSN